MRTACVFFGVVAVIMFICWYSGHDIFIRSGDNAFALGMSAYCGVLGVCFYRAMGGRP